MVKEIILHVGLHKTGTSSIQNTLYLDNNNKILEKNGYIYPTCWNFSNHSITVYSAFCDHPEKYHINIENGYSIEKIEEINKKYLKDLETEVIEKKKFKLIISGEDISNLTHNNLYNFKKYLTSIFTDKIKIFIYIRNPLSWGTSVIQEIIKGGKSYEIAFNETLHAVSRYLKDYIEKFTQVFGRESLFIYSFEDTIKYKFGLIGHFLSAIGVSQEEINEFDMIRSNDSISLIATDMINYINHKLPLFVDGKLNEKRSNEDIFPLFNIRGPKFDIPNKDKKTLLEISREDAKWLKDNFGIDYSYTDELSVNEIKYQFTPDIIEDIQNAYSQLSENLKPIIVEYLGDKLRNTKHYFGF